MVSNSCLYCRSDQIKSSIEVKDIHQDVFHIAECGNCGLHYLNPIPTKEQLEKAYDVSYYGEGEKKFLPWIEAVIDFLRSRNAKSFSKWLKSKAVVLDLGCGNGQFLKQLSAFGSYELHGLEIDGGSANRAKLNEEFKLHIGELMRETYPKEFFDAIILTHVFEHLLNPEEALDVLSLIARKQAILQIEIPNIDSWQFIRFKANWLHIDPPRHIHFYTPDLLEETLKKRGWDLKSESYFSPQFSPFGFQQSMLNAMGIKRDLLYESMKGNQDYVKGNSKLSLVLQYFFHYSTLPFFMITDAFASIFKKGATVKMVFQKA